MTGPNAHTPARIYRPSSNAMQSARRMLAGWVLEFEPADRQVADPLMGWIGSGDMDREVKLHFTSKEQAIAYAEAHEIAYVVIEPHKRSLKPKSYAENFLPRGAPRYSR
jgi:hypothetical protein